LDALGFDWRPAFSKTKVRLFEERIEDLRSYKEKHGHLNIKQSQDKSLAQFCIDIRYTRKNPGKGGRMKMNEERIASLDALGFDWRPACTKYNVRSFEKRMEDLRSYKEKHGHLNVKQSQDKSLAQFCTNIRYTRKNLGKGGRMKLNEECIASLDALGFDWRPAFSKTKVRLFEERIEDLRSYKEKHGHLNIKQSQDKSLAQFCIDIRYTRKNPGKGGRMKMNEERIASLDALGFDWRPACTKYNVRSFEKRMEDLRSYKEKHGHLNVKQSQDKSLAQFCTAIRYTRKNPGKGGGMKMNEERIASLDALGFDWRSICTKYKVRSCEERIEDLKSYKEKYGHLNVK